jgi:hypothetical protein
MKEPRKIVGGELVRRPDETDEQWASALREHEMSRRIGRLFLLKIAIDDAVAALFDVEEPTAAQLREAAEVAEGVLESLRKSSRRDELATAYDQLSAAASAAGTEIARSAVVATPDGVPDSD